MPHILCYTVVVPKTEKEFKMFKFIQSMVTANIGLILYLIPLAVSHAALPPLLPPTISRVALPPLQPALLLALLPNSRVD